MSTTGSDASELFQLLDQSEDDNSEAKRLTPDDSGIFRKCVSLMSLDFLDSKTWNILAIVYMLTDQISDSASAIQQSLELDTSNSWTWRLWAKVRQIQGNVSEAESSFRMAFELDQTDKESLLSLARLAILRKAFHQALEYLYSLIELDFSNQVYWDMITLCLRNKKIDCLVCQLDSVLCSIE
ncbi:MAG: hypothetical protein BAJATHORv1_30264 [Candidatus Thorarchaeota archaeon]|nr:MAG: hypothetical protein BAJATHORv1_30264 [Candidatus Thorarchaeota archaeon]